MLAHAVEASALNDCAAIAIAQNDSDSRALIALGRRVGFGSVIPYSAPQPADRPQQKVIFFLVHYGIGPTAKQHLLTRLRRSPAQNIRFAPVILFVPDGPYDEMLQYIEMGFDDVICLPEKSHLLASRLGTQVGQEHLYVQTASYLGPDRRRMELPGHTHPGRDSGNNEHTKLFIIRSPDTGVRIVRRQIVLRTR